MQCTVEFIFPSTISESGATSTSGETMHDAAKSYYKSNQPILQIDLWKCTVTHTSYNPNSLGLTYNYVLFDGTKTGVRDCSILLPLCKTGSGEETSINSNYAIIPLQRTTFKIWYTVSIKQKRTYQIWCYIVNHECKTFFVMNYHIEELILMSRVLSQTLTHKQSSTQTYDSCFDTSSITKYLTSSDWDLNAQSDYVISPNCKEVD